MTGEGRDDLARHANSVVSCLARDAERLQEHSRTGTTSRMLIVTTAAI